MSMDARFYISLMNKEIKRPVGKITSLSSLHTKSPQNAEESNCRLRRKITLKKFELQIMWLRYLVAEELQFIWLALWEVYPGLPLHFRKLTNADWRMAEKFEKKREV